MTVINLLTPEVQTRALAFGFRPATPDVKVLGTDPDNPWNRLKPYGVRLDVPAVGGAYAKRHRCDLGGSLSGLQGVVSEAARAEVSVFIIRSKTKTPLPVAKV